MAKNRAVNPAAAKRYLKSLEVEASRLKTDVEYLRHRMNQLVSEGDLYKRQAGSMKVLIDGLLRTCEVQKAESIGRSAYECAIGQGLTLVPLPWLQLPGEQRASWCVVAMQVKSSILRGLRTVL